MASFRGNKAFMSNFHPAPVYYDGVLYPTTEHAFVAAKTLNIYERTKVSECSTPAAAKKYGRTTITLRKDWHDIQVNIMKELVFQKFFMYPLLAEQLLAQEGEIVETNEWHDCFWGACECNRCLNRPKLNHLGKILMSVRDHLRGYRNNR